MFATNKQKEEKRIERKKKHTDRTNSETLFDCDAYKCVSAKEERKFGVLRPVSQLRLYQGVKEKKEKKK